MKSLLQTPWMQALLGSLLGRYLSFALYTTRWRLIDPEHFAPLCTGAPSVLAFWHECLPFMPSLAMMARHQPGYRPVQVHTLVSLHRDGRFIGNVMQRFGVGAVLGSSSRGGAEALRRLLRLLTEGCIIAITPDGPRGPRHQAQPGVAQLAALAGVPIVPCAVRTTFRLRLKSWDRMLIPLPFGRGVIVCGPALTIPRTAWREAVPVITQAMNQVTERAEQLCHA